MGGGLMQLVAYGAQDIYLTGNPQITFFKVVYRRHTNFSMECIEQTINGVVGAGSRTTTTVSRNGDLVSGMYIRLAKGSHIHDTTGHNWGHNILESVECEIGGQKIDKHLGQWMETDVCLTEPRPAAATVAFTENSNKATPAVAHTKFQRLAGAGGVSAMTADGLTAGSGLMALDQAHYVPLRFWFCRNPGLALPLIALQYHEVKVVLNWANAISPTADETTPLKDNVSLWADYIYLDTDERRRFAQVSHEYLIEQVQHQDAEGGSVSTELNFNHPIKELIWVGKASESWGAASASAGAFAAVGGTAWQLKLNGHDRLAEQPTSYFTNLQVWKHHTGNGGSGTGPSAADSIAVYSFALKPEEHQPSGTCNFSRIDNAQLKSTEAWCAAGLEIFAINYNVLRIMSGMGGLAYSN